MDESSGIITIYGKINHMNQEYDITTTTWGRVKQAPKYHWAICQSRNRPIRFPAERDQGGGRYIPVTAVFDTKKKMLSL